VASGEVKENESIVRKTEGIFLVVKSKKKNEKTGGKE
jgi:hypothetical protein